MGTKLHRGAATFLLTVFLAFVSPCLPQDIEILQKGVVKVTTTTFEGKRKIGTGFIVRLGVDVVYIVTASHVIEGARDVKVEFFTGRNRLIPVEVLGLEGDDPRGLAALAIEGKIPAGVSVLKMDRVTPVRAGEPVTIIGFPDAGGPWAVTKGEIVGRKGKTIAFSGAVDEGNSGGPLIKEGQVIGVVTEARAPFAYAAPAVIAQYVLESWGVKFGDQLRSRPARLEKGYVVQMIREKGFHHPGDLSKEGLSGSVRGNFEHEYELKTLNGDPVVIDHATGLMWQQSGTFDAITSARAKEYLDEVNREGYAGFSDWRLPTVEELVSLLEPIGENEGLYIHPVFDKTQQACWSADTSSGTRLWRVDYQDGIVRESGNSYKHVRGVRSKHSDFQKEARDPASIPTSRVVGVGSQLANTKIAFVSKSDNKEAIHVMNADGTNPRRLTNGKTKVSRPAWSPDGTKIAFVSKSDNKEEIHVMNADGTDPKRLTETLAGNLHPAWSPDGTKIAFASDHGAPAIYVMNADGTNLKRLTVAPIEYRAISGGLSWSPDGAKIAFVPGRGDRKISIMNANGTALKELIQAPLDHEASGGLSWSPDGTKIAFVTESDGKGEIYVINADGTDPKRLTETLAGNVQPAWSPDGTKIAFASHRYGNWEIYVMDADGTNPRRLTKTLAGEQWPAWSPFLK